MAVGRYDDDMRHSPKLIAAGDRAAWLWWCSVQYSRNALTDGFIPRVVVPTLFPGAVTPRNSAAALVRTGLWRAVDGGYQIHDYLDWNPSKVDVLAEREKERARKRRPSSPPSSPPSGVDSGVDSAPDSEVDSERRTRAGARSAPLRSAGSGTGEVSEGGLWETDSAPGAVWRPRSQRTSPLTRSSDHLRCHPVTAAACGRGICVPAFLVAQWIQQGGEDFAAAEAEVRAAVLDGLGVLREGPVGDDPLKFWRGVWTRRHGSQAPQPPATRPEPRTTDWFEECKALHAGACDGRYAHETKMAIDAEPEGQPA